MLFLLSILQFSYITPLHLEIGGSLQVVCIQPVRAILQENLPHISACVDGPTRCVPEPCCDAARVRIADKLGDVGELCLGNISNAAPADGNFIVRRSKRSQGWIPGSVQRGVSQLGQRRVEEVIAWR
jgi:hypothetical protein